MATFVVTNAARTGGTGMTFAQAVQAAAASAGADTIKFAAYIKEIFLSEAITLGGELTIDGDRNGDGISDVLISAASEKRHLNIDVTGIVTIKNVDFFGGRDTPKTWPGDDIRPAAQSGTNGTSPATPNTQTQMDGATGADGGNGTNGSNGSNGLDAAGSILNRGTLTLVRVGFGGNYAAGEVGQAGGWGGFGGDTSGERGETDYRGTLNDSPPTAIHDMIGQWNTQLLEGGRGGDGGHGGAGGNGGNGGNGGDAGVIVNQGALTLIDTVFAGRLSSGALGGPNEAHGGGAGAGGGGGRGGYSYGGDGGDFGRQTTYQTEVYNFVKVGDSARLAEPGDDIYTSILIHRTDTAGAGEGGAGGLSGNGGSGGSGGTSGDAGTIVNRGTLNGYAALINTPNGQGFWHNESTVAGEGARGAAGAGGKSFGGDGGVEATGFKTISYGIDGLLDPERYDTGLNSPPAWVQAAWAIFAEIYPDWVPRAGDRYTETGNAADGASSGDGTAGAQGSIGSKGSAITGVRVEGTGSSGLQANNTLVYAHGLGQDPVTGRLAFNIIRVGNFLDEVTVKWRLVGNGSKPVSAADFAPGTKLSGTVTFVAMTEELYNTKTDVQNNVRQISLALGYDTVNEVPEGYKFELYEASPAAILGTKVITGTAVDGPPDFPTSGRDSITGSNSRDVIDALAGNDTVFGNGGNDDIKGNSGNDSLDGGSGKDKLDGGTGDNTLRGGTENDTLTGGTGKDKLYGDAGDDSLTAGKGNDTLDGGTGKDKLDGGDGDDSLVGGDANDTLTGGTGKDKLSGGKGNDTMTGGDHADTFVFAPDWGHDLVTDFRNGTDKVQLTGGLTFADVNEATISGGVRLTFDGQPGLILDLKGITKAQLDAGDFIV